VVHVKTKMTIYTSQN